MKRKQIFSVATVGFLSLLLVVGAAVAAVFPEDNTFTGTVNQFEKGIKIGKQDSGGVTFFNGTIVNATTTNGIDNPVTFGDNVRIDGRIHRGDQSGPAGAVADTKPVQINDDLEVYGQTTMKGKAKFEGGVEGIYNVNAYSKDEVDTELVKKASKDSVYTKEESDGRYELVARAGKLEIPGSDFLPSIQTLPCARVPDGSIATTAAGSFFAGVELPIGAQMTQVDFYLVNNDPNPIDFAVLDRPLTLGPPPFVRNVLDSGLTNPGPASTSLVTYQLPFSGPNTRVQDGHTYYLNVVTHSAGGSQEIHGAIVEFYYP